MVALIKNQSEQDIKTILKQQNDLMSKQIKRALINNEFINYYQPQIDVSTGKITGIETLIRWQHPQKGLIYPNDFIPFTEMTGMIVDLGDFVLEKACRHTKKLHDEGFKDLVVGVNVSANQIKDDRFVHNVKDILARTGLSPDHLELEITERVIFQPTLEIKKKVTQLKEIGVRFSIDDFGTGYSSLSNLRDFSFDTIKIDRSFIHKISTDNINNYIVESIVYLGEKLNLRVIAEGVETSEEFHLLKRLRVREVQGFLLSKPISFSELENKIFELVVI